MVWLCPTLLLFVQPAVVRTHGQSGPPPDLMWADHACVKALTCSGATNGGECETAGGWYCYDTTCSDLAACAYDYDWACQPGASSCLHTSDHQNHSPDCGPTCVASGWGTCQCQCRPLGSGTMESGIYWQCYTLGDAQE
jgi:hypothetical protein